MPDSFPFRFTTCYCAVFMVAVAAASPPGPAAAEQRGGALEAAWRGLGSTEVGEAYRAAEALFEAGDDAVALIAARFGRPEPLPVERIERLIGQLDDDAFEKREAAQRELLALMPAAQVKLRTALGGELSAEQRARLRQVLADAAAEPDPEALRRSRAAEMLGVIATADARSLLERIIAKSDAATPLGITAQQALERAKLDHEDRRAWATHLLRRAVAEMLWEGGANDAERHVYWRRLHTWTMILASSVELGLDDGVRRLIQSHPLDDVLREGAFHMLLFSVPKRYGAIDEEIDVILARIGRVSRVLEVPDALSVEYEVDALVTRGHLDEATDRIARIQDRYQRLELMITVGRAHFQAGEADAVEGITRRAEQIIATAPKLHRETLRDMKRPLLVYAGRTEDALETLQNESRFVPGEAVHQMGRGYLMERLAVAVADTGEYAMLKRLASLSRPIADYLFETAVTHKWASDERDAARQILNLIDDENKRRELFHSILWQWLTDAPEELDDEAIALVDEVAAQVERDHRRPSFATALVIALASSGNVEEAQRRTAKLQNPDDRLRALAAIGAALHEQGEHGRAARVREDLFELAFAELGGREENRKGALSAMTTLLLAQEPRRIELLVAVLTDPVERVDTLNHLAADLVWTAP